MKVYELQVIDFLKLLASNICYYRGILPHKEFVALSVAPMRDFGIELKANIWTAPKPGELKMNYDASVRNGFAYGGYVCRDDRGIPIFMGTVNVGCKEAQVADVTTLKNALQAIGNYKLNVSIIEGNSDSTCNALNQLVSVQNHEIKGIANECRVLLRHNNIKLRRISKHANRAASIVAQWGHSNRYSGDWLPWKIFGPQLFRVLHCDRFGPSVPEVAYHADFGTPIIWNLVGYHEHSIRVQKWIEEGVSDALVSGSVKYVRFSITSIGTMLPIEHYIVKIKYQHSQGGDEYFMDETGMIFSLIRFMEKLTTLPPKRLFSMDLVYDANVEVNHESPHFKWCTIDGLVCPTEPKIFRFKVGASRIGNFEVVLEAESPCDPNRRRDNIHYVQHRKYEDVVNIDREKEKLLENVKTWMSDREIDSFQILDMVTHVPISSMEIMEDLISELETQGFIWKEGRDMFVINRMKINDTIKKTLLEGDVNPFNRLQIVKSPILLV